jgi:hypothetical protein
MRRWAIAELNAATAPDTASAANGSRPSNGSPPSIDTCQLLSNQAATGESTALLKM